MMFIRGGSRIFLGGCIRERSERFLRGVWGACPPEKIEYLGGGVGTLLEVWDPSGWEGLGI